MRIAQIAPLWELVPPQAYGGTELVVHLLTDGLVSRGHDVTLFAASGSDTAGRLRTYSPKPLRALEAAIKQDKTHCTVMATELRMLEDVFTASGEFDVIHNHIGFQALPFASFTNTPVVTTLHNALAPAPVYELFMRNAHLPYISISHYQQALWPDLNYASTIYHGIDLKRFRASFSHEDKNYLAFLGRLSPEKGPQHAIHIARALGMKLILAGKVDRVDQAFYDRELAHLIDGEQIRYIGEVGHARKVALLSNAAATLCPVEWPEPFGLVMIESMACGTPVFALRDGSVPEVIDHGYSGFIADSVEALIEAVKDYRAFDRRLVRKIAEERFSVERMVLDHERLYEKLAQTDSGFSSIVDSEPARKERATPPTPILPSRLAELRQSRPVARSAARSSAASCAQDDVFCAVAGQVSLDEFGDGLTGEAGSARGIPANYPASS